MAGDKTVGSDSEALRREVEALRAERRGSGEAQDEKGPLDETPLATSTGFDVNWDELRQVIQELGDELEHVAHQRPVLGMVGAFVLGVLIGRAVSR